RRRGAASRAEAEERLGWDTLRARLVDDHHEGAIGELLRHVGGALEDVASVAGGLVPDPDAPVAGVAAALVQAGAGVGQPLAVRRPGQTPLAGGVVPRLHGLGYLAAGRVHDRDGAADVVHHDRRDGGTVGRPGDLADAALDQLLDVASSSADDRQRGAGIAAASGEREGDARAVRRPAQQVDRAGLGEVDYPFGAAGDRDEA